MWMNSILFLSTLMIFLVLFNQEVKSINFKYPVECGFDQMKMKIHIYPIQFFFFTSMFLVLDVEFINLLPSISTEEYETDNKMCLIFIMSIWFMILMEFMNNNMQWEK